MDYEKELQPMQEIIKPRAGDLTVSATGYSAAGLYRLLEYIGMRILDGAVSGYGGRSDKQEAWSFCVAKMPPDPVREALAFAASVIKSGEPWTDECERVIGGALRATSRR